MSSSFSFSVFTYFIFCLLLYLIKCQKLPNLIQKFDINRMQSESQTPFQNVTLSHSNDEAAEKLCLPAKLTPQKFSPLWADCEENLSVQKGKPHYLDGMLTTQILDYHGYATDTYNVKTKDGYYLTVYRIVGSPNWKSNRKKGTPVYLNHGLIASSDFWFFQQKDRTLPIKLADSGFDVWLSNSRGTSYSLRHDTYHYNKDLEYWDFSFHEMGIYDMPAVTDQIIATTGFKKILYIGYSMGTTQAFIGLAELPSLNRKIIAAFMVAPTAYMGHCTSETRKLGRSLHQYETFVVVNQRFRGRLQNSQQYRDAFGIGTSDLCSASAAQCGVCDNMWFMQHGYNAPQMNRSELPNILKRFPNTASVKSMSHYGQLMNSCKFQKYSYSREMNLEKYGSATAPEYKLENIKSDVYFYYAENDNFCVPLDVQITANGLKRGVLKEMYLVPDKWFTHMDFAIAKDADKLAFDKIIEDMSRYKKRLEKLSEKQSDD